MNAQSPSKPVTILLVDDDPGILEGVADLLALSKYNVLTATDGHVGLRIMQETTPDLIISDIMMPNMDGYQFFEAVRSRPEWVPIPFIFLTARGQRSDINLGTTLGADYYLVKPFEPEDLMAAIAGRLYRVQTIETALRSDIDNIKQQLITIFSHELRTPLTYIYGYVNLLKEQYGTLDEATVQEMLEGIQKGANRLVGLVEDLMLMVRLDSGVVEMEITLRSEPVTLSHILSGITSNLTSLLERHHATLIIDVPSEVRIMCIMEYIQIALNRIVNNGIKFSDRANGRVYITADYHDDDGMLHITVTDNGIGISADQKDLIFERFQQADRKVLEQQGVGLGLAIAHELVTLHNGRITLESTPGAGASFTMILPALLPDTEDDRQMRYQLTLYSE